MHIRGKERPPVLGLWILTLIAVKGPWRHEEKKKPLFPHLLFSMACPQVWTGLGQQHPGRGTRPCDSFPPRGSELHGQEGFRRSEFSPGWWLTLRLDLGGPGPCVDERRRGQLALQGKLWRTLFSLSPWPT